MDDYDITVAFEAIERELIASMMRNMSRHRAEETNEGYEWSMWQTEQIKALENYKRENQKRYKKQFKSINKQITVLIQQARQEGNMEQEIKILQAIKKGWKVHGKNGSPRPKSMTAEFFRLNDRKLAALIEATVHDMQEAEKAILRKAEDDYRKAIFNAQVYANTGAGTYEKAVDMATRDMLSRGLGCVEYANGSRHTLVDYASMAIRTASKRAYLYGEGEKRQEWGITTVIMAKRGNPCPKCLPFVGKVLVDDVWSGGRSDGYDPETGKRYPTISHAIECGLYHPNCKDSHTTYFPGISTADDKWTAKELRAIGVNYDAEQRQQYAKRQAEKYGRLAEYSLDEENKKNYKNKVEQWKAVEKASNFDILNTENTKEEIQVHSVGKIDRDIYKCITADIVTDEVIITDNQIQHILDRHPDAYETAMKEMRTAIESPDYIIADDKHNNTGLVIKKFKMKGDNLQLVLRICTHKDEPGYKNSVISCWEISEKRLENYLKNKRVLYKKE